MRWHYWGLGLATITVATACRSGSDGGDGSAEEVGGATGGESAGHGGGATGGKSAGHGGGAAGGKSAGHGGGAAGGKSTSRDVDGPTMLWRDDIQGTSESMGFDGLGTEHPIGTTVHPSDANGANVSRTDNPAGDGGYAMRHYGVFDAGGARAQAGIYGDVTIAFGDQAKRREGVWVAQEWYFPEAIGAEGHPYCWLSVWDWHSIDLGPERGGNRWHTSPGLMVSRDGSMHLELTWGNGDYDNGSEVRSSIAMPVGRWFDIEMHYEWTETQTGTIQVWLDGELAIEKRGVKTRRSSHGAVETYAKFYGSSQTECPGWTPTPAIKYTRNMRVAGERIWR